MRLRLPAILLTIVMITSLLAGFGCSKGGLSPGDPLNLAVGDVEFTMRYAPGATFPTGLEDDGEATVDHGFWIGETEVTYELWYELRIWAEDNGYKFANRGTEGGRLGKTGQEPSESKKHPVTTISWYDSIVWCNALSEYLEYTPVYTYQGEVYRDATNRTAGDNVTLGKEIGFRLPTNDEWELAARYKGSDGSHGAIEYPEGSKNYWTPGNYVSGAKGPITDEEATMAAAWYKDNSEVEGKGTSTQDVGQKPAGGNGLKLYDMSGNVFEWLHLPRGGYRGDSYYHEQSGLGRIPKNLALLRSTYPNLGLRVVLPLEVGSTDDPNNGDIVLFPVTSLVDVEWEGKWYQAQVLEVEGGRYYITYSGYDSSWDEWVDSSRIRERVPAPVIAAVKKGLIAVDHGTALSGVPLPTEVGVILKDGSIFSAGVKWDTKGYDGTQAGEYELIGELEKLPINVTNPDKVKASITVRVRDVDGSASHLRTGGETNIEGILFYIEHDDDSHCYYFGTNSPTDLSHFVIEDSQGQFVSMIIFDVQMYPIQWVFPDLTIGIIVPRNQSFDPKEAVHTFIFGDEQEDFTLDIEMNVSVGQVLDRIPLVFGAELSGPVADIREKLQSMGWESMTVAEVAELAGTYHEVAFASFLSVASVGISIIDQLESYKEGEASTGSSAAAQTFRLLSVQDMAFTTLSTKAIAKTIAGKAMPSMSGTVVQGASYLARIASGYYDGHDIEGPAVSMLLCKGASSIPQTCTQFYMANVPGNASKCVQRCKVTMSCFTDICHPMKFSVQDALSLRRP